MITNTNKSYLFSIVVVYTILSNPSAFSSFDINNNNEDADLARALQLSLYDEDAALQEAINASMHPKSVKEECLPTGMSQLTSINEASMKRIPASWRANFKEGECVAVLAGTSTSGFGGIGSGFTSINIDQNEIYSCNIKLNFNETESFNYLSSSFDAVIVETPGPENSYNVKMFESGMKILKPGGRLIVSIYDLILTGMEAQPWILTARNAAAHTDTKRIHVPQMEASVGINLNTSFVAAIAQNIESSGYLEQEETFNATERSFGNRLRSFLRLNVYVKYIRSISQDLELETSTRNEFLEKLFNSQYMQINPDRLMRLKERVEQYLSFFERCEFVYPVYTPQPAELKFRSLPHGYISFIKKY